MRIANIDKFIEEMEARGYRKGLSFHYQNKPDHSLWKSFHKGEGNEMEHKGYQICLGIWNHAKYDENSGIDVSFDMKMNHQTPIQCERMDIHMMDDGMDVQEFERRCEELWNAMKKFMPRKKPSPY